MNYKYIILLATLIFGLTSCGGDAPDKKSTSSSTLKKEVVTASTSDKSDQKKTNRKGKLIYKQYCVACHGADGKLGISDAKDLSISTIDLAERINQVTNGKGMMTPYKDILTETQIKDVCEYLDELIVN